MRRVHVEILVWLVLKAGQLKGQMLAKSSRERPVRETILTLGMTKQAFFDLLAQPRYRRARGGGPDARPVASVATADSAIIPKIPVRTGCKQALETSLRISHVYFYAFSRFTRGTQGLKLFQQEKL